MANNSTVISSQIYASRDQIRNQIIEYARTYLELDDIDLTKSSFLTFLINTFSTLTSNLLFCQLSSSREFFLTEAQLDENILNLSAYIGYTPYESKYATTNVLINIEKSFSATTNVSFTIPESFIFKTVDGVPFSTFYSVNIFVDHNNTMTAVLRQTSGNLEKTYTLPVGESTSTDGKTYFNLLLPVRQYQKNIQEFQLDSILQELQFITVDVPLEGKISSITVQVKLGATYQNYTKFNSLFLMGPDDFGYIIRRTTTGRKLYFGNGLIGKQPPAGGTVIVTINETLGSDGNVISGSINIGDKLYITEDGRNKVLKYTCTNTEQSSGGTDEESIEDIRRNSIANIVSLGRLVSEQDFVNSNSIIKDSPIGQNSLPILKRSDVKNNEILLFITLLYQNLIVPTKNAYFNFSPDTVKISREYETTFEGDDYVVPFDIYPNYISKYATYKYVMSNMDIIPSLESNTPSNYVNLDGDIFSFVVDKLTTSITTETEPNGAAKFELHYISDSTDSSLVTCDMITLENNGLFKMTQDGTTSILTCIVDPYEKLPEGNQKYEFKIYNSSGKLMAVYTTTFTFRKVLDDFMISNMTLAEDGTNYTIYDVPLIKKSFYDGLTNKKEFESIVMQKLLTSMSFSSYKMLTDFINIKFSNTTGIMKNMEHNVVNRVSVKSISLNEYPDYPSLGDRYIVNGNEAVSPITGPAENIYKDYFVEWQGADSTSAQWIFTYPTSNDIVLVEDVNKKYIFTDIGWRQTEYTIPLKLEVHIFREPTYSGTYIELANLVKTTIVNEFESRFGINISLYKSEIIKVVQGIEGVNHCRLVKPESDIFFNYDVKNFSQIDLLKYAPEYVYFTEDDIIVKIIG